MCLSGTWTWHSTYYSSHQNIKLCGRSAETLVMLASCSVFFQCKSLMQLNTQRKQSYKKSQYDNLDLRSTVPKERAGDAFYHWVIMSLGLLLLSRALQISFWQGTSVSTNSEKEHLVKVMWCWHSAMCSVWNHCFWRGDQILIFAPFSLMASHH